MFRAVASAGARKAVAPLQKKIHMGFFNPSTFWSVSEDGWNVTND